MKTENGLASFEKAKEITQVLSNVTGLSQDFWMFEAGYLDLKEGVKQTCIIGKKHLYKKIDEEWIEYSNGIIKQTPELIQYFSNFFYEFRFMIDAKV